MKTLTNLINRNRKLFFRDKGMLFSSLITPLILIVLYLTRTFWLSIAWWVYLFAAGVGLILYAIKREKAE